MNDSKFTKIWLGLVTLLATWLRVYNNTSIALWHDEAFSALYIKYSWAEMMQRIILDVHPPLYYFVLRLWHYLFGYSLLSLRSLSILLGVATVWMGYLFVKKAFGSTKVALLAALLLAINPFQIQYALEARMYTLGTFLLMLSCYLLLFVLENPKSKYWIYYGISVAALAYTHYFLLFSIVAQGLFVLYYYFIYKKFKISKIKEYWPALGSYVLAGILYLPWLPSFLEQNSRVQQSYWIPAMDRWSVPTTIWKLSFGSVELSRPVYILISILTVTLLYWFIRNNQNQNKWLVAGSLAVPFLAAILISLKTALYLDRYFVFASIFLSLVAALTFLNFTRSSNRRLAISLLVILSITAFYKNWSDLGVKNLFFERDTNHKPGMAAAANFVNERAGKDDNIYVGSSFIFFTFKYYNQTEIKPLLYSTAKVEEIPHFSGTAILTN